MGFFVRLMIFPILLMRRIVLPMLRGALAVPLGILRRLLKTPLFSYGIIVAVLYFAVTAGRENTGRSVETGNRASSSYQGEDPRTRKKITALPEVKGRITNGNSAFRRSVLHKMEGQELLSYSREFYYAMEEIPAGTAHLWKLPGDVTFGSITPGTPYTSKGGSRCRGFEELLVYKQEAQRIQGKSCQRGDGLGWCKLRMRSASSCDLGYSPGMFGGLSRWWQGLF